MLTKEYVESYVCQEITNLVLQGYDLNDIYISMTDKFEIKWGEPMVMPREEMIQLLSMFHKPLTLMEEFITAEKYASLPSNTPLMIV